MNHRKWLYTCKIADFASHFFWQENMDMGLVLLNPVTFCPKEEVCYLLNTLTVQIMNAKQYKINVVY